MRAFTALIVYLLFAPAIAQNQPIEGQSFVIGEISFFGYAGLPVDQIRSSLPFREGDTLAIQDIEKTKAELARSVQRTIGRGATDVDGSGPLVDVLNLSVLVDHKGGPIRQATIGDQDAVLRADLALEVAEHDIGGF